MSAGAAVQPRATALNDPAIASFGTLIQVLSSGPGITPEVFTTVEGTGDIDGPSRSLSEIETTSHSTGIPVRTFIPSLHDPGELSFPIKYNPAFPTHSPTSPFGLERLYNDRTVTKWRLVATDPGRRTREFYGFVREFSEAFPVDGTWEASPVIRISGLMYDITPEVTLTPASAAPLAAGGPASFAVAVVNSQGGSWFPVANDPWISIVSPTVPQSADGSVSYSVTAQSAGAPERVGTITVAGQTFTVTQAAGA